MQSFRKQIAAMMSKKLWVGNRYPRWQRLLCAGFVLFFTVMLPFICFGAFAEPGHPHQLPHFVFADPLLTAKPRVAAPTALPQSGHEGHDMGQPVPAAEPESAQPVGRSVSSLILFSILMFSSLGVWLLSRIDRRHVVAFSLPLFLESVALAILLPPPRRAVSA